MLQPKKNYTVIVLCGETSPALVTSLKAQYGITERRLWTMVNVLLKPAKRSLGALALLATLGASQAQQSKTSPTWPKDESEYVATSSETIPSFPRTLSDW